MRGMNATVETYYAVRIGIPGKHVPYFMVRRDEENTPWLFTSRSAAELQRPNKSSARVVRVKVKTT